MKKIIIFLLILIATILLTSCSTQQRVVYRDCDCPINRYDYWNRYSWGNPYWGWNTLELNYWNWNNLYWRTPPIIRSNTPSRYERRQSIGTRPSRNNWSNDVDNTYPRRTPNIPSIDVQPNRIQSTPNRYSQPQQRTTQPSRVQSNPSRYNQNNQNTQPSRVQSTPSRQQTRGGEIIKE
jgi:hypothetical protein